MAYTTAQLVQLEKQIASGLLTSSFEGKTTTFRSLDEMLRLRDMMRIELGLMSAGSRTTLVAHSRGFGGSPASTEDLS